MENIKRNYKDNLFVSIFGKSSGAKENFLSIYNAIHDTNLKIEDTKIEPMMLENVVYTGLNNDVSMLINDRIIVLAEQQSTINENMPFRCLEYVTRIYEKLFESKEKYKKRLLKFPNPEFYVFYNGEEKYPKEKTLKLSDAFFDSESNKFSLELTVKVYNINYKENHPILEKINISDRHCGQICVSKFDKTARSLLRGHLRRRRTVRMPFLQNKMVRKTTLPLPSRNAWARIF